MEVACRCPAGALGRSSRLDRLVSWQM